MARNQQSKISYRLGIFHGDITVFSYIWTRYSWSTSKMQYGINFSFFRKNLDFWKKFGGWPFWYTQKRVYNYFRSSLNQLYEHQIYICVQPGTHKKDHQPGGWLIWYITLMLGGLPFWYMQTKIYMYQGVHLIQYMSIRFTFVCNQKYIKKIISPEGDLFDT